MQYIFRGEADPPLAATLHAAPLRQGFGMAGTRATTAVEAAVSAATFKILQATSLHVASAWQARLPLQPEDGSGEGPLPISLVRAKRRPHESDPAAAIPRPLRRTARC